MNYRCFICEEEFSTVPNDFAHLKSEHLLNIIVLRSISWDLSLPRVCVIKRNVYTHIDIGAMTSSVNAPERPKVGVVLHVHLVV